MDIHIVNKQTFDSLMFNNGLTDQSVEQIAGDTFFISITDTDKFSESREPYFRTNHINVLNLAFDDCTVDGERSPTQPKGTRAMNQRQAFQLYNFIKRHLNKPQCIVHCMAGISRSGAIGTFINDLTNGDYYKFKKLNPQIHPNQYVLGLLNKEHNNESNNDK